MCLIENDAHVSTNGRIMQLFNYFADLYYKRLCVMIHAKNVMEAELDIIDSVPYEQSQKPTFYFNYHLNLFYIDLSAFLDNLAWFLNFLYELGYKENAKNRTGCGLEKTNFINKVRIKNSAVGNILTRNQTWIERNVYLKRHSAAHRLSLGISTILTQSRGGTAVRHLLTLSEESGHMIFSGRPIDIVVYDLNKAVEIFSQIADSIDITEIEALF
jgi:hypothetical protein